MALHAISAVLYWNSPFGPVRWGAQNGIFCGVGSAIFWRIRGEVQRPGTVAPGHDIMTKVCGTVPLGLCIQRLPVDVELRGTATSLALCG